MSEIKYQNGQILNECTLVTIWNAARFWGIHPVPKMGTANYKKICNLLGGFDDGCSDLDIFIEMNRLGLKKEIGLFDLKWVRNNLPVEFCILSGFGKNKTYHSTLAVEVQGQRIRLLNYEKSPRERWIYWHQIKSMSGYYEDRILAEPPRSIFKNLETTRPVVSIKEFYK